MTPRVLYISYDGMLEPLGQSQVLAYIKGLAVGNCIHLISFEKPGDLANETELKRVKQDIASAGIVWHQLRYHKRPTALATAWDIACGAALGSWLVLRHQLQILHARSYVPSVMALIIKHLSGVKFLFDMRGFWADERVDGGLWQPNGRMFQLAKWFERRFLLGADHVISLTHAAVMEMEKISYLKDAMPPVTVIPTCVDLKRFCVQEKPKDYNNFVLGYVGSAGTWYLFEVAVACFRELLVLKPDSRFLIVNRNEHDHIKACLHTGGVPLNKVEIRTANHAEVPAQMARMNVGIFFIKPVYSKKASAPTKLAEFLGCGVPCLGNAGVGDMAEVLEGENVGVALRSFDEAAIRIGLELVLQLAQDPRTSSRCVDVAHKHFSLEKGVARYQRIYADLDGNPMDTS